MTTGSRSAIALLVFLLLGLSGCSDDRCADHTGDPLKELEIGRMEREEGFYESSPWNDGWVSFPPSTPLAFKHGLGRVPEIVRTYLSFSADGTQGSNASENAGNQGLFRCIGADAIVLMNDTCEDGFYVRVVATATPDALTDTTCLDEPVNP